MKHIICFVVELENFPFAQIFVVTHIHMFFRFFLLHWLLHGWFRFGHHGSRLLLFFLFGLITDPSIFLFINILNRILEILFFELSKLIELLIFLKHTTLNFLRFFLNLLNSNLFNFPISFLSLDDFRIVFDHIQLTMMHCCYVVVN